MHGYFQKKLQDLAFFLLRFKNIKGPVGTTCKPHTHTQTLTHTLIGCSSLISPADSAQH